MQQRSCLDQQTDSSPSPRYSFLHSCLLMQHPLSPNNHLDFIMGMIPSCTMQLDAIKVERGVKDSDGLEAPLKPLVEVLREAKEAKEEAFQAVWRSMKTGERDSASNHFMLNLTLSATTQELSRWDSHPAKSVVSLL